MKKAKTNHKKILLILGIIYLCITILAVISYVSTMKKVSSTPVTFFSVLGSIWWQILMIALFAVTYVVMTKKQVLGALLETAMGIAMLVYIAISIALLGSNILAIVIELIYPIILVVHGLIILKTSRK